jgi:hypothetical protein
VEMPEVDEYKFINKGMLAIDPETGNGWVIQGKAGRNGFEIAKNLVLDVNRLAIVPKYQLFKARRERIISQEQYNIGCHAHGNSVYALYLFYLVKYSILRYREGLFEHNNFQLSNISCTDFIKNDAFGEDKVYSRFIVLSGQVEESWIKNPFRIIESIDLIDTSEVFNGDINLQQPNENGNLQQPNENGNLQQPNQAGIKVYSNEDTVPTSEEAQNDLWTTIDEDK